MLHARSDYQKRIIDNENLIPADEPVFLLRAQDVTAAAVVREWVHLNKRQLAADRKADPNMPQEKINARRKAITLAEAHAFRMEDWAKKKVADVP